MSCVMTMAMDLNWCVDLMLVQSVVVVTRYIWILFGSSVHVIAAHFFTVPDCTIEKLVLLMCRKSTADLLICRHRTLAFLRVGYHTWTTWYFLLSQIQHALIVFKCPRKTAASLHMAMDAILDVLMCLWELNRTDCTDFAFFHLKFWIRISVFTVLRYSNLRVSCIHFAHFLRPRVLIRQILPLLAVIHLPFPMRYLVTAPIVQYISC